MLIIPVSEPFPFLGNHNYPTTFAANNFAVKFNKISTRQSIRYAGNKFRNQMIEKKLQVGFI